MTNNERIQANNAELREAIEMAEKLPDADTPAEIVLQSKTVTPTESVQEVTADADYTALEKVTVEAIPSEYIVPNGTKNITSNGTHSVTEFDEVNVNVPIPDGYIQPSGTLDITENGEHDVTEYARVTVDVKGSGGQTIYYTRGGACYVANMIIEPNDGVYNASSFANRYQHATHLETVEIPNIVLSASVSGVFAFCSSLRTAKVEKVTNYGHYWFRNCTALETAQLGSLGYPVTNMTTLVFSGDTQTNLTITIYVDATTIAELPTTISNNAPFGATKATIVYRNSTTGEVITE